MKEHGLARTISVESKTVLVCLNGQEKIREDLLRNYVWPKCWKRICADGGANVLFDVSGGDLVPDVIIGDLDSLRENVREHYESRGTELRKIEEQIFHDFEKVLYYLTSVLDEKVSVVVMGGFGGRLDHFFANFNMLFKYKDSFEEMIWISNHSLAILLDKGSHVIHIEKTVENGTCGVVPMNFVKPSCVTSEGLRWDLNGLELKLGGMISSSNEIVKDTVTITTDSCLIWTSNLV